MIYKLSISGFRGFGQVQSMTFAIPDGKTLGSGLTIITGANNSGKTTIIEAIRAFNSSESSSPTFSEGRRNSQTNGKVELTLTDELGKDYTISSVEGGGSSTQKSEPFSFKHYVLPSRRAIPFEFSKGSWSKDTYILNAQKLENQRSSSLSNFDSRIFQIEKRKNDFDQVISKVLGNDFQWTVEQRDSGNYYIKYTQDGVTHSSEGVGDGIWSIFTICAALFDAEKNSVVVIDEPELSVHPALQKRLMKLFLERSMEHQIILCTHSPYCVSWEAIVNGAQLIRVVKDGVNSKCHSISEDCKKCFGGILRDLNNPHTLGTEANEALFLNDGIILVEGQEDVVILKKVASELGLGIQGEFFGWGVGGAAKMRAFLLLFRDLGFKHVVAILDGDKADDAEKLSVEFASDGYMIITLAADDIRDKQERLIQKKAGITTDKGKIKEEYRQYACELISEINTAL